MMRGILRRLWSDERGSALALVAVTLLGITAMLALAIDLGMLYTAHGEAQRVADSAALAGASTWVDGTAHNDTAKHRALQFAAQNVIRSGLVDTTQIANTALLDSTVEAVVQIIPTKHRVRVTVRRTGLGLWFGKLLDEYLGSVRATAVAEAINAGAGKCVVPLALPDAWNEETPGSDSNGNRTWDTNEDWAFNPGVDQYGQFGKGGTETGYGSGWRDTPYTPFEADYGRQLAIKPQSPNNNVVPTPGWFFPFRIGNSSGAKDYEKNFWSCSPSELVLGVTDTLEMGNMVGPSYTAIDSLMKTDNVDAHWVDSPSPGGKGTVVNSKYGANWLESGRVVKIALFDPNQLPTLSARWKDKAAPHTIVLNNIAMLWLDGYGVKAAGESQPPIVARFLYYASGTGGGPASGSLVKYLRLVQ